jgi:hypothetical protein
MGKYLDRAHRTAVIGLCWIMVIVSGSLSFYLQNEIWIRLCQVANIIFAAYGFYLFMLFMYDYIKDEAWIKYRKELDKLKKGD